MGYDNNKVVTVAKGEVGYLEKKSNHYLNYKTKNAGTANYTKYGKAMGCNGDYWCDAFVDWCFVQAYGKDAANKILGGFSNYTPTSASYLKGCNIENAKAGYIIFFKNSTRICHTGIIRKIDKANKRVYTIEGNTSGASGVVANGGGVAEKYYSFSNSRIAKVCVPNFGTTTETTTETTTKTPTTTKEPTPVKDTKIDSVKEVQNWINDNYHYGISEDGVYGAITKKSLVKALQKALGGLAVDGVYGKKTNAKVKTIKKGSKGTLVKILQAFLICNGYKDAYVDGECGNDTVAAIKSYQKKHSLVVDGKAGKKTFAKLCK